ncbi:hypothetical protein [Carboxylicivirga taeanensis]|uniref:hypothetical protein n=1 Tax=Carboxylicivirga taeanensis TaxID=1416875 RepID=UPI003F6DFF12
MKKKLFAFGLLLILVFAGNWVYGRILSKKIEAKITHLAQENDLVQVEIEHIRVNPLFSTVTCKGIVIRSLTGEQLAEGASLVLDMPYREVMRLLNNEQIDQLQSMRMKAKQLLVPVDKTGGQLLVDEVCIDFDGVLTSDDIRTINRRFPDEAQRLYVSAKGLKLSQVPGWNTLGFTEEQFERYTNIEQVQLDVKFDPQARQLQLLNFQLESALLACNSTAVVDYSGDGWHGWQPRQTESSFSLDLKEKGMQWGDKASSGKYTLGKLSLSSDALMTFNSGKPQVKGQKSSFLLEDLTIEYAGRRQAELEAQAALLGLKLDRVTIGKLAIHSQLINNKLVFTDSELQSSLLNLSLHGEVQWQPLSPKDSQIETATIILSNLAPGIQNGLSTLELMTGQSLPRKGDAIVLELSGALHRPAIKGLKY